MLSIPSYQLSSYQEPIPTSNSRSYKSTTDEVAKTVRNIANRYVGQIMTNAMVDYLRQEISTYLYRVLDAFNINLDFEIDVDPVSHSVGLYIWDKQNPMELLFDASAPDELNELYQSYSKK